VVCVDDDAGLAMAALAPNPVTVSAIGGVADWRVEGIRAGERGAQEFAAVDPAGVHHALSIGLPGRYNVANALLAAALLDEVGVSPEQAAPGLRDARVPGRLEPIDRGQDFLALVDYAHKPGALRAVLETLRAQATGRVAVVFGAGGNRDPGKRGPMGQVAAELADLVIVTDDNPRDEDPALIRSAIDSMRPRECSITVSSSRSPASPRCVVRRRRSEIFGRRPPSRGSVGRAADPRGGPPVSTPGSSRASSRRAPVVAPPPTSRRSSSRLTPDASLARLM